MSNFGEEIDVDSSFSWHWMNSFDKLRPPKHTLEYTILYYLHLDSIHSTIITMSQSGWEES